MTPRGRQRAPPAISTNERTWRKAPSKSERTGLRTAAARLSPSVKSDTNVSMVPSGDQKGTW
jgi:hypothetical protein